MVLIGTMLQPMAWVIPPASRATTAVPLILSKMLDFPWSTCPSTVTIGRLVAMAYFEDKFFLNLSIAFLDNLEVINLEDIINKWNLGRGMDIELKLLTPRYVTPIMLECIGKMIKRGDINPRHYMCDLTAELAAGATLKDATIESARRFGAGEIHYSIYRILFSPAENR